MPDDSTEPGKLRGRDYSRATYEEVLFAVAGVGVDLHRIVDRGRGGGEGGAGWFTVTGAGKFAEPGEDPPEAASASAANYHAYEQWWYGVSYNNPLFDDWKNGFADMSGLMPAIGAGKLGLMDVPRLYAAKAVVDKYVNWLDTNSNAVHNWVTKLDSDDSAFRGRAAYAVQGNLKRIEFMLNDLQTQLTRRNPSPSHALGAMADSLSTFGKEMAGIWHLNLFHVGGAVNRAASFVMDAIHNYIWGMGLIRGTENYNLDRLGGPLAKVYIDHVLRNFDSTVTQAPLYKHLDYLGDASDELVSNDPAVIDRYVPFASATPPDGMPHISGDLRSQATWDVINSNVSSYVENQLAGLDAWARVIISSLDPSYVASRDALKPLVANRPPNLGTAPGGGVGGGIELPPGLGGGDIELPPGLGGGGGDFELPPGLGGGAGDFELPPGLGGGGGDIELPPGLGGGGTELPPDGGLGDPNDPFGDGSSFDPNSVFETPPPGAGGGDSFGTPPPLLVPPLGPTGNGGSGTGSNRPPSLEPFPNGIDGDGWAPPGLDEDIGLPQLNQNTPDLSGAPDGAGGGVSNVTPPPGIDLDKLAGGAGGLELPGGAVDLSGGGLGGAGQQVSGGVGGSGEGWADWSGGPGGNSGGGDFRLAGEANQAGGMPMMPPMMPPMGGMGGGGGGGGGKGERERETWLSEDEKVWGAASLVGSGVIGRPTDGERTVDEPLAPTHVHVRNTAPRGAAADKKRRTPEETQSDEAIQPSAQT